MSYRTEKLYVALSKLASGTGTIRERFEDAYSLALASLEPADFPEDELQHQFESIRGALEEVLPLAKGPAGLGPAMDALSEHQIQELAEQVLSVFYRTVQIDGYRDR